MILRKFFNSNSLGRKWYSNRQVIVLGIETSCDDTAVAIVGNNGHIYSETIIRQDEHHKIVKGINPRVATDLHQENIDRAVQKAIDNSKLNFSDLTAIAVTRGPGIGICLEVGLNKAKQLTKMHNLPLIAVNHMEGHALVARMTQDIPFPFLALLISGGHSLLIVCKGIGHYLQLGTTLDDSIGEAYDKTARLFDLEWEGGGGKALEKIARNGIPGTYNFSVPMKHYKNCEFSFSGLKSAVKREFHKIQDERPVEAQDIANLSYEFQETAAKHLLDRLNRAIVWCKKNVPELNTVVVSGGVASNEELRRKLREFGSKKRISMIFPPIHLCSDNGVMIAWAGIENYNSSRMVFTGNETDQLYYEPKWPLDPTGTDYFPGTFKKTEKICIIECEKLISEQKYNKSIFSDAISACIQLMQYDKGIHFCEEGLKLDPTEKRFNQFLVKILSRLQTHEIE
jgi:N6-L-threonylcarbamoyladenine synthase